MYNFLLKEKRLHNRYENIKDGDKIKFLYLKEPNHLGENCVAFNAKLPSEFDLHRYVDYELMFEKAFIDPLKTIAKTIGWNTQPIATLEDLFS
jgi:DNA polymerase elongation subunit (family B)